MNWSSRENIDITYRLLNLRGFGSSKANRLLWSLSPSIKSTDQYEDQICRHLSPMEVQMFRDNATMFSSDPNIGYLSVLDNSLYPLRLKNILKNNTPTILTYMGNIDLLKRISVGYSGSRKVSEKGLWITRDSVAQLADKDICIVSGYANGVDLTAHKTALEMGGSTIIVLPEGIKGFYIRSQLKDVWDWNRVLVISEFFPNDKWRASRAMQRNQTIIGLSDALLVVEAGETGGSLDAGMKAMNMGRTLFVPFYQDVPESALGNTVLLSKGAKRLMRKKNNHTNVDSLLLELNVSHRTNGVLPL